MSLPETAVPEGSNAQSEVEIVRSFLRISGVYLFSCAYRDVLRAAYARQAVGDPVLEHELRYREHLACEAISLVRSGLEDETSLICPRTAGRELARPEA